MSNSPAPRRILLAFAAAIAGCQAAPAPPRVPVPSSPEGGAVKTYEPLRPLRPASAVEQLPPPAFDDAPLVTQAPPEQPAYLDAYARVGRPRLAIFVNRTIEGQIIPVDDRKLVSGTEVRRKTDGAIDVQSNRSTNDGYRRGTDRNDGFKTTGPADYRETSETYLAAGQYDAAQAAAIDYGAIELALADTLAANGRVTLVSPTMARQRLTDAEVKDLQSGRPTVLREVADKLDADVLIQVQARPTKQTAEGLTVRVLVEAINTKGGESVARSFVDVPPPLDKPTINRYARFLARKTMYELAGAWASMENDPTPRGGPMPTTQPR